MSSLVMIKLSKFSSLGPKEGLRFGLGLGFGVGLRLGFENGVVLMFDGLELVSNLPINC